MKAWRVEVHGEPAEVMQLVEVEAPRPGAGQVLVRTRAAPANFPDVLMCRGTYQTHPELPFVPGVEACGDVVALGDDVDGFTTGDRVLGTTDPSHGGFAEYAVLEAGSTFPAPSALTDPEASTLCIAYQTGWFALRHRAAMQAGETLLVHAAAGGVGSAAVQLGKAMGATVIGVVGNDAKVAVAKGLGADVAVNRHHEDFVEVVNDVTYGRGADVVFDPVGGQAYSRSTKCIAFEGRLVLVGFAGGEVQSARLNHALVKNYSVLGLHWGLYRRKNPAAVQACHHALTDLATRGALRPLVSETVTFDELATGVQRLADGVTVGRVVYEAEQSTTVGADDA